MFESLIDTGKKLIAIDNFELAWKIGQRADIISNHLLDYKKQCDSLKKENLNNIELSLEGKAKMLLGWLQNEQLKILP